MSSPANLPAVWHRLGERVLLHTRIFDIKAVDYRHPQRDQGRDFLVIDASDWVNVLAVTPDRQMVLVNQFRFGVNALSWELPGGVIEKGEDPLAAGVRELEEETGFVGERASLLGWVHPNPAIMSNRCHIVVVEGAVCTRPLAWDPDEELQVTTVPGDDVYQRALAGEITHALVLNALLRFRPRWREIGGMAI